MATDSFTIRIFVPDGDPDGVRIIDRMNWTGLGIAFPRVQWPTVRERDEFNNAGVYILSGYPNEDDLPTLYIGQGDGVRDRIQAHYQEKVFWDFGIAFVSHAARGGLNRAHITWLEHALVDRARKNARCRLDNGTAPREPSLAEFEKADTQAFLREILQILPLMGMRAFETPRAVATPKAHVPPAGRGQAVVDRSETDEIDTIVVPAKSDGFEDVFLGQNAWWAVRIAGGMLPKIRYIAAYQTQPVSAITHIAPVERIELYGEGSKYKLLFSEPAQKITPVPFGNAVQGSMQGSRYTSLKRLRTAKSLAELFGKC